MSRPNFTRIQTVTVNLHGWLLVAICVASCGNRGGSQPVPPRPADAATSARSNPAGSLDAATTGQHDAGSEASASLLTFQCLSSEGVASANTTVGLLLDLDKLMEGFGPPPDTFQYSQAAPTNLTAVAAQNDPAQARARRETERAERAARQAYARVVHEWNTNVKPIAWTWDTQWDTVKELPERTVPARFACWMVWLHGLGNPPTWFEERAFWTDDISQANCNGESAVEHFDDGRWKKRYSWRQRSPSQVFPASREYRYILAGEQFQPELTKRIQANGTLHPEQDQACIVLNAVVDHGSGLVTCFAGQSRAPFEIKVPPEAVAPGGVLASLGVGDLVKIRGHQILRKRFISETDARWQWDEVPVSGISIPERARAGCSSPAPSPPDAGVSAARGRRRARTGDDGYYSGSSSTGSIHVEGCRCSGNTCDCR